MSLVVPRAKPAQASPASLNETKCQLQRNEAKGVAPEVAHGVGQKANARAHPRVCLD